MQNIKGFFGRWVWSVMVMGALFAFSSTPGKDVPNFGAIDYWVKKGGHMLGYAVLASTYWSALGRERKYLWSAWLLSVLYGLTDEFHQSLVPGRHASPVDVILFDSTGALLALCWISHKT